MFKFITTLWFSILSVMAYIVVAEYMALKNVNINWASEILDLLVVALFCAPWGYLIGSKIRVDKARLLNGLLHSAYIGLLVTLLTSMSLSVFMALLNAVDLPFTEALLVGLGIFMASILIVGPITFSIGTIGSVIFWLSLAAYKNHLTSNLSGRKKHAA